MRMKANWKNSIALALLLGLSVATGSRTEAATETPSCATQKKTYKGYGGANEVLSCGEAKSRAEGFALGQCLNDVTVVGCRVVTSYVTGQSAGDSYSYDVDPPRCFANAIAEGYFAPSGGVLVQQGGRNGSFVCMKQGGDALGSVESAEPATTQEAQAVESSLGSNSAM